MNSFTSDLVTALATDRLAEANNSFKATMAEKMNLALDTEKVAVASRIYTKEAVEVVDESAKDVKPHVHQNHG